MASHQFIGNVKRDLRESTYFRVALVIGACVTLLFVIGFFKVSIQATFLDLATGWRIYFENVESLSFPYFQVSSTSTIADVTCLIGMEKVPVSSCGVGCFEVRAGQFKSAPPATRPTQSVAEIQHGTFSVECFAVMDPNEHSQLVSIVLENNEELAMLTRSGSPMGIFVAPGETALIGVSPVQFLIQSHSDNPVHVWETNVQFPGRSADPNPAKAMIASFSIVLNSFAVKVYEQIDPYTTWMALGDIGGLGVFFWLLFRYFMFLAGFVVRNDSHVFAAHKDTELTGASERTPILGSATSKNDEL